MNLTRRVLFILGQDVSGGLDTRCAVAWMSRQGMSVCAYTADLAQPDEKDPAAIPPVASASMASAGRPRSGASLGSMLLGSRREPGFFRVAFSSFNSASARS